MAEGRLKLAGLHPDVRRNAEWAIGWADYYGVPVRVVSGFRSWAEQTRLRRNYEQCLRTGRFGKTPDCQYPANRPGDSSHNYGLSWDSTTDRRYQEWWNEVRRLAGFEVLTRDLPHAQVPRWRDYVR